MKPKRYFKHHTNFYREDIGGVYFLIKKKKVVYIGCTANVVHRIFQHRYDKDFDSFRLINCNVEIGRYYEARLIRIFMPKYNKNGFKGFSSLESLYYYGIG